MTTSPRSFHIGEIWLSYLHFSDRPDLGKIRPVLIVDVQMDNALAVALKVTSKNPADGRKSTPIPEWKSCGLRKPSYVRTDQIFEIPTASLLGKEPLGALSQARLATILQLLDDESTESPEQERFPS